LTHLADMLAVVFGPTFNFSELFVALAVADCEMCTAEYLLGYLTDRRARRFITLISYFLIFASRQIIVCE